MTQITRMNTEMKLEGMRENPCSSVSSVYFLEDVKEDRYPDFTARR